MSVILPYYKDENSEGSKGDPKKEIVFRRHVVDRMPVDCWNDVWRKLHQQLVNVDVINVNTVSAGVYTTIATFVVWSMRLALSIALYIWIDSKMRPIYAKVLHRTPGQTRRRRKLKRPSPRQRKTKLGSLGKSR